MISAAFASIPVLNASFLLPASKIGHGSLCVDLKAVRSAYDLILSTEALDPLGVVTLGRATLHLAEQLKECPVDDAENLSVFLIVLENPLMLRASHFHVAIEMVCWAVYLDLKCVVICRSSVSLAGDPRHSVDPQVLPPDPVQVAEVLPVRVLRSSVAGVAELLDSRAHQQKSQFGPHTRHFGA